MRPQRRQQQSKPEFDRVCVVIRVVARRTRKIAVMRPWRLTRRPPSNGSRRQFTDPNLLLGQAGRAPHRFENRTTFTIDPATSLEMMLGVPTGQAVRHTRLRRTCLPRFWQLIRNVEQWNQDDERQNRRVRQHRSNHCDHPLSERGARRIDRFEHFQPPGDYDATTGQPVASIAVAFSLPRRRRLRDGKLCVPAFHSGRDLSN